MKIVDLDINENISDHKILSRLNVMVMNIYIYIVYKGKQGKSFRKIDKLNLKAKL